MWKQLELLPRPDHAQVFLRRHFNGNEDFITACFDRTSEFSLSYPCTSSSGGACSRRVVELPGGVLVAVCGDVPERCDDLAVEKEDTRIYIFRAKKTANHIADQLAAANIVADIKITNDQNHLIKVGFYVPRGTIKFPVYFHMSFEDGDYALALNQLLLLEKSFVLLLPTRDGLSIEQPVALKNANSLILGMDEISDTSGHLNHASASSNLRAFYDQQPDPDPEIDCKIFSTPPRATWDKFIFDWQEEQILNEDRSQKAHKREVVIITCGGETHRYEPADLNMMNKKTKEPNLQWVLLRSFIQKGGSIGWGDEGAADNVKTQKKELIRKLKKAFCQEEDPIPWDDNQKHYKCRFICRTSSIQAVAIS